MPASATTDADSKGPTADLAGGTGRPGVLPPYGLPHDGWEGFLG